MQMRTITEILADLLDYPDADWKWRCEECRAVLNVASQSFASHFALFSTATESRSLTDLQEVYTRTFDLSPVCALEVGYHLFGENYKRGVFLANLRETEAPFDLGQAQQLPDYLPVLLRLLTRLADEELRGALIVDCLIPALGKMLKTLSEGDNPYRHLLAAVNAVLQSEAGAYPATIQRAQLPVLQAPAFRAETQADPF
jgi:nitrate reductase molybdenum cofactor assembly chaperone NarJ/NarW